MGNGSNAPRTTWHQVIDAVSKDAEFNSTALEAIKAPEVGPRAPVVLLHRFRTDAGKDWFRWLPEPGSDQEKRTNGLYFRVSEGEANDRDSDAKRYWDKYKYSLPDNTVVEGSVYLDMADRHPIGIALNESIKIIDDWENKDLDHSNMPKVITIDGTAEDIQNMPSSVRTNRRNMLSSRRTRFANNMRRAVDIERNIDAIHTHLKSVAVVGFVYAIEGKPSSGIAKITETIRVIKLITDPEAVDAQGRSKLGQESSVHESFTANQFINLSVDAVLKKEKKLHTYDTLIDSKRVKAARAKKGQGKQGGEGSAATASNLGSVFSNIRIFTETDNAKTVLLNRLSSMKVEERMAFAFDARESLNFLSDIMDKDMLELAARYQGVRAELAKANLKNANAEAVKTLEAESQPTQNQRNAEQAPAPATVPETPSAKTTGSARVRRSRAG